MINYYTENLNPIGLSKRNRVLKLFGIKTKVAQISFLKRRIFKGRNGLIVEFRSPPSLVNFPISMHFTAPPKMASAHT